jgi:hypothetical protein
MKKIEQYNLKLNQSFDPDKTQSSIGNLIRVMLSPYIEQLPNKNAFLCIGSGRLHDVDISFYEGFFNEIILTDVDIISTKRSLEKVSYSKQAVKLERIEYTGYEISHFFDNLAKLIKKKESLDTFEKKLTLLLEANNSYRFLKSYEHHFDFIYVSPIYTQLFYQQLLLECAVYRTQGVDEPTLKLIEDVGINHMNRIIKQFNMNVIRALKHTGLLAVASDILEFEPISSFGKSILESSKQNTLSQTYTDYFDEYGMGLGDYGLYHLDHMMDKINESYIIWPFNSNKHFLIKMCIYKNKGGVS